MRDEGKVLGKRYEEVEAEEEGKIPRNFCERGKIMKEMVGGIVLVM